MANVIEIPIVYNVTSTEAPTYTLNTLNVLPMGITALSGAYISATADTRAILIQGIKATNTCVSSMYVVATPLRLLSIMYAHASNNNVSALCLRRGMPCIRVPNWVYTMTEGSFGRIHIPTDPYM